MTSGNSIPSVTLNDDRSMPTLGIGVAELTEAETERAVSTALELGCRLIDTAKVYGNEAAVGRAIAASGIPREEMFVTTKSRAKGTGLGLFIVKQVLEHHQAQIKVKNNKPSGSIFEVTFNNYVN